MRLARDTAAGGNVNPNQFEYTGAAAGTTTVQLGNNYGGLNLHHSGGRITNAERDRLASLLTDGDLGEGDFMRTYFGNTARGIEQVQAAETGYAAAIDARQNIRRRLKNRGVVGNLKSVYTRPRPGAPAALPSGY